MSSYNSRINKVANEIKNMINSQIRCNGNCTTVYVSYCELNSVNRNFGGSLNWQERNKVINKVNNHYNVECIEDYGNYCMIFTN